MYHQPALNVWQFFVVVLPTHPSSCKCPTHCQIWIFYEDLSGTQVWEIYAFDSVYLNCELQICILGGAHIGFVKVWEKLWLKIKIFENFLQLI